MSDYFQTSFQISPFHIPLIAYIIDPRTQAHIKRKFVNSYPIGVTGVIQHLFGTHISPFRIPMQCSHRIVPPQFSIQSMVSLGEFHMIISPISLPFQYMMGIELGDERKIVVREIIVDPISLHFEPFGIE